MVFSWGLGLANRLVEVPPLPLVLDGGILLPEINVHKLKCRL